MIGARCICGSYELEGFDKWAFFNDDLVRQVRCRKCGMVIQITIEEVGAESIDELILSRLS